MFGMFPWQGGKLYEDPQARFTMVVDLSWEQVETDGRYAQFKVPDLPLNLYLLVLKAGTVDYYRTLLESNRLNETGMGRDSFR